MAYDKGSDKSPVRSDGETASLFIWSKQTIGELKKKGRDLKKFQLDVIAYLWEVLYDLLLPTHDNVTTSLGFELLGLRVSNHKKWKRPEE